MVETGGILLGLWQHDVLIIKDIIPIPNHQNKPNRFVFTAYDIAKYINRRDFVGLFHTHRRIWLPSRGDHSSAKRLATTAQKQIVIGIVTSKPHYWLYTPDALLPRLITRCENQVNFIDDHSNV